MLKVFHCIMTIFGYHLLENYIFNPSQTQKIGPFTSKHNHNSGLFATEVIHGEILILEYFQPEYENNDLKLSINRFAYAYQRYKWRSIKWL